MIGPPEAQKRWLAECPFSEGFFPEFSKKLLLRGAGGMTEPVEEQSRGIETCESRRSGALPKK